MRTIILYGDLAKRFGRVHKFAVSNVAEALKALKVNYPGFAQYFAKAHLDGFGFHIRLGRQSLEHESEVLNPSGALEVIRIIPMVMGSGGVLKIFIGAVLVAGGIFAAPFSAGASSGLIAAGIGLVIGGVSQLLTGVPQTDTSGSTDRKTSYLFSGPVNSSAQGGAVPIGYGRLMIGSVVISAGINNA